MMIYEQDQYCKERQTKPHFMAFNNIKYAFKAHTQRSKFKQGQAQWIITALLIDSAQSNGLQSQLRVEEALMTKQKLIGARLVFGTKAINNSFDDLPTQHYACPKNADSTNAFPKDSFSGTTFSTSIQKQPLQGAIPWVHQIALKEELVEKL